MNKKSDSTYFLNGDSSSESIGSNDDLQQFILDSARKHQRKQCFDILNSMFCCC